MKRVITLAGLCILFGLTGCSGKKTNAPSVSEIEQAMINEYVAVGVDKEAAAKMVGLEKINKCENADEKQNPGVHICEVKAKTSMAIDSSGKEGAVIKVAVRQKDGQWETVEGLINEGREPEVPK
jgi:hypothetical protein